MKNSARTEPPQRSDQELFERIRRGDRDAFELLFRAYYDRLCTFAEGYIHSFSEAEEVVEDVLLTLWQKRAEWKLRGSIKSYLYGAVRNRALDHLKHRRVVERVHKRVRQDQTVPGMGEAPPAPDERLETAKLQAALQDAIESLPERCRQTHLLRWRDGLSHTEIADAMGVSINTVDNQLKRALKLLRERLSCSG